MSSKFMKFTRIILPTLTMVVIATQLMGCSSASKQEMSNIIDNGSSEVEILVPELETETGLSGDGSTYVASAVNISWTKLHSLQNANELREILNTYTNPNDTLLTAYQNADFVNALSDTNTLNTLSSSLSYTDLDDSNSYEAVLNVYFDLLPDTSTSASEFNGDVSLTRGQAMTLITRATIEVPESGIPTSSESFTSKVGTSPYTDYASYQDGNAYISSKQGLDSENFNAPMSTAEFIYMTVNAVYGGVSTANIKTDGMAFKDGGLFLDEEGKHMSNAQAIAKYVENPDGGLPSALYDAVCIAYFNGAITNNTNLDDSISKTEAINILDAIVNSYTAPIRENQSPTDDSTEETTESTEDTTVDQADPIEDTTQPQNINQDPQQPADNTPTPTEVPKQETPAPVETTPAPTEAPKQETPAPTEAPPQIAPQQPETPPSDNGGGLLPPGPGGTGDGGGNWDDITLNG